MSKSFTSFVAVGAAIPTANMNTDAIIPAAFLRSAKADVGKGLFGMMRYDDKGEERPDFILNQPLYRSAKILFGGPNFGCGSSREAAAWALQQFGFEAVFAPSFADIFYENAFRNGLLAAIIPSETLSQLAKLAGTAEPIFAIDLALGSVTHKGGYSANFEITASRRDALLRGDDEIDMTMKHEADIAAFHARSLAERPWLHTPLGKGL